jgi:ABC-type transporter Mla subunit MlaD
MAEPQGESSTQRTRRASKRRHAGEEEGRAEIEGHPTSPDDVNSLKRKFYDIIDSTTPGDLNNRRRLAAEASLTIQSASLQVMVEDTVKDSLNVIEGKLNEVTDSMKNLAKNVSDEVKKNSDEVKKVSDEVKKVSDEVKKNSDEVKKVSDEVKKVSDEVKKVSDEVKKNSDEVKKVSDEVKKNSDEVKKVSDEVKKVSDKLEALPGIVRRAVLAPLERAGQVTEESVRDSLRNFPEGGHPPRPR